MINMRELGLPVRKWVPNWLALASVFIIILPVTMLNGSYTGSMLEVSNTLGTNTEDITMGYYAASVGMAIAYPIVPKVLAAFSTKFLLLAVLSLQIILSWIRARSQGADILIVASFAIGFLKGFLMLWFIRHAQKIFSPKNVRSEFYSYFYPLVYGGGQLSMVLTAELAYHYDWKYMYYFMMVLLLLAILIIIICYRHDQPMKKIPIEELHLREMFVIAIGLLMLMYVANYGKMLDWMSSYKICAYIVIAPILIAFFVWMQYHSQTPYVNLAPLYQPKAIVGYFYMMLIMFFSTSTTLLTNYMTSILKVDTTHSYVLYIWLIPGYLLGAFICFWWFRWQRWRFRFFIAGGMACFAAFFGILYFGISRKYIRNALLSHLPARAWHAFPDYCLCIVCCRRPESEVSAFERVFPHHLPFGTGSYHCYFLLQQYPIPAGTKIHALAVRNHHHGRPACCLEVFPVGHERSDPRTWVCRSYSNGDDFPL